MTDQHQRRNSRPTHRALTNAPLLAVLAFAAAAVGIALFTGPSGPKVSPASETPTAPGAEFVNVAAAESYYLDRMQREPQVADHYAHLAQLELQKARETGNEALHVPIALDLLGRALEREPEHPTALALRASVMNTLHRFEDARAAAKALIELYPRQAYHYGTLTDALVELGEYEEAIRTVERMIELRPGLSSYARASYLRELHGDGPGAIDAMRMAADAGAPGRESRSWALVQLGHLLLGEGRLDEARRIFEGTLEERADYGPAIHGLVRLHLVARQPALAVPLLESLCAGSGFCPYRGDLAEAYRARGDQHAYQATMLAAYRDFHTLEAGGENVDMELADFLADHAAMLESIDSVDRTAALLLAEAMRRAVRNLERRPDHLHSLETSAWVLHAAGQSAAAVPLIEHALRFENGDAKLLYRAALISQAAGRSSEASARLREAIDSGLEFEDPAAFDEATVLHDTLEPPR